MVIKEFRIYQVPEGSPFYHDFAFRALDGLRRAHLGPPLPREAYDLVYVFRTEASPTLDWIFCFFNRGGMLGVSGGPPSDYTGRSISVGDIVETDGQLWYCDAYGWVPVSWATPQRQHSTDEAGTPRSEAPGSTDAAAAPLEEE